MADEIEHKCFISFKKEDEDYKNTIKEKLGDYLIDKSLNELINSNDEKYIMRKIREDHLSDSTVTIFLIGEYSSEDLGYEEQKYIKRELQASLYNGEGNTRNGILGVVLPSMDSNIYKGPSICPTCGLSHNTVYINDSTVIKEFSYNYYLPDPAKGCCWSDDDRYCVLAKWTDFINDPQKYINEAFDKRDSPIADKIKVKP